MKARIFIITPTNKGFIDLKEGLRHLLSGNHGDKFGLKKRRQ